MLFVHEQTLEEVDPFSRIISYRAMDKITNTSHPSSDNNKHTNVPECLKNVCDPFHRSKAWVPYCHLAQVPIAREAAGAPLLQAPLSSKQQITDRLPIRSNHLISCVTQHEAPVSE